MCDYDATPCLRTFIVRMAPLPGLDLDFVRVTAQDFHFTRHQTLELWRHLPTGLKQIVAAFEVESVIDVYEEAA